jgi:hypothetical protein
MTRTLCYSEVVLNNIPPLQTWLGGPSNITYLTLDAFLNTVKDSVASCSPVDLLSGTSF